MKIIKEIIRDFLDTPFYSEMQPSERLALVTRIAAIYRGSTTTISDPIKKSVSLSNQVKNSL